jgi:hypothetical protein
MEQPLWRQQVVEKPEPEAEMAGAAEERSPQRAPKLQLVSRPVV